MNRKEVLTKAIAIAKRNGYDISEDFFTDIPAETWLQDGQDLYYSLIFDHEFAKCFFGESFIEIDGFDTDSIEVSLSESETPMSSLMSNRKNIQIAAWEFHIVQLVLSKDPLLYISNFINCNKFEKFN